jgi:hypothetical protein
MVMTLWQVRLADNPGPAGSVRFVFVPHPA